MTAGRARAKRPPSLLLSVAGLVAAIIAGVLFVRPARDVTTDILNASGKPIQWAEVVYTVGAAPAELVQPVGPVAAGETKTVRYSSRAKSHYRLIVHFADGSEVKGGAGHARAGNRFTETVLASMIGSEPRVPKP